MSGIKKKIKDPNEAWKNENPHAQFDDPEDEQNMPIEFLLNSKKFLRKEWPKKRQRFISIWESMTHKSREDLIRVISPNTPHSPANSLLIVDGEAFDLSYGCALVPHMCISELVPGNKFIELLDARTDPSKDDNEWTSIDLEHVRKIIAKKRHPLVKGSFTTMEKYVVNLVDGDGSFRFGQCIRILKRPTSPLIEQGFKHHFLVNLSIFESLRYLQEMTYGVLCSILEEVETEIFDKDSKFVPKQKGCNKCNSFVWKEDPSETLKLCACRAVAYCSKECQKEDWKAHKPYHKVR